MELKAPLTYKNQIKLLQSRNLVIKDKALAKNILSHVNYYRLSAYGIGLKKDDIFYDGVSLEAIYSLYQFDTDLRNLIFKTVGSIEINLRTKLAYCLAFRYGSEAHLKSECFDDIQQFAKFVCNFYNDKKHQGKSPVVLHHEKKYKGKMPIWAAVELLTFGTISRVYSNLKPNLQKQVAKTFLSDMDSFFVGGDYLKGWFKSLVELRNSCAHFDRLYNKRVTSPPKLFKEHKLIKNDTLFALLLVIGRLVSSRKTWILFIADLSKLLKKYPYVKIERMGFPDNWKSVLYGQKSYRIKI